MLDRYGAAAMPTFTRRNPVLDRLQPSQLRRRSASIARQRLARRGLRPRKSSLSKQRLDQQTRQAVGLTRAGEVGGSATSAA